MLLESTTLTCPLPNQKETFEIDLQAILTSEVRQDEIATVTITKAPELLAEFNRSWRDIHSLVVQLTSEKNIADREVDKRRATLTLDDVPRILKEKGLASNEANREAVIALDADFERLQDVSFQIEAVIEYLRGKMKAFDNAFTSVKKLMGGNDFNQYKNEHLTGGADAPTRPGFGKPRY